MDSNNQDMRGMTINERLFSSGKLEEWDRALGNRDIDTLVKILRSLCLSEHEAIWTVNNILTSRKDELK